MSDIILFVNLMKSFSLQTEGPTNVMHEMQLQTSADMLMGVFVMQYVSSNDQATRNLNILLKAIVSMRTSAVVV